MKQGKFIRQACIQDNIKWLPSIARLHSIYKKKGDIRSEFNRDYNRILHSKAYRRLKHKTQVFYATQNDHVCTRMEHVGHVAAVSYSISGFLGLNTELTSAIALGHDIGHAPFGHKGEHALAKIAASESLDKFWHEQNSLFFADHLETLPGLNGKEQNLDLTYAVRDGIISHCGEVNENAIFPREEPIELNLIDRPNRFSPFTWEGCIVKIADKISYLGRDIEDALTLKILTKDQIQELKDIVQKIKKVTISQINNTILMHDFISNLCSMSSPQKGIMFSPKYLQLINSVKEFNYKNIYGHQRLKYYNEYASLIITSLYNMLSMLYDSPTKLQLNIKTLQQNYPDLCGAFHYWLIKYSNLNIQERKNTKFDNNIVYNIEDPKEYKTAILHYISSMTDQFAIKLFGELTRF